MPIWVKSVLFAIGFDTWVRIGLTALVLWLAWPMMNEPGFWPLPLLFVIGLIWIWDR